MDAHQSVVHAATLVRRSCALRPVVAIVSEVGRRRAVATAACSLAEQILSHGRSVAVVDCDFQGPVLQTIWQRGVSPGLSSVLAGERKIDDVFDYRALSTGRFLTVTAGGNAARHAGLFATGAAEDTLRRLVDFAEVVLVNVGPLSAPYASNVVATCDAAIVINDDGLVPAALGERLQGLRVPIMASVLDVISTTDELVDNVAPELVPSWLNGDHRDHGEPIEVSANRVAHAEPAGDTLVRSDVVVEAATAVVEVPVAEVVDVRDVEVDPRGDDLPSEFAIDNLWDPAPPVPMHQIPGAVDLVRVESRQGGAAPKRKRRWGLRYLP